MNNEMFLHKSATEVVMQGGMEILRITYPVFEGDTPAERHLFAMTAALSDYAKDTVAKIAVAAWRGAIQANSLFSFYPYTYRISLHQSTATDHISLTLGTTLTASTSILSEHSITMYWTKDGTKQLKRPPKCKKT